MVYIIEHIRGSCVPFRVKASSEDEALERVYHHMGSTNYKVVGSIDNA